MAAAITGWFFLVVAGVMLLLFQAYPSPRMEHLTWIAFWVGIVFFINGMAIMTVKGIKSEMEHRQWKRQQDQIWGLSK